MRTAGHCHLLLLNRIALEVIIRGGSIFRHFSLACSNSRYWMRLQSALHLHTSSYVIIETYLKAKEN